MLTIYGVARFTSKVNNVNPALAVKHHCYIWYIACYNICQAELTTYAGK